MRSFVFALAVLAAGSVVQAQQGYVTPVWQTPNPYYQGYYGYQQPYYRGSFTSQQIGPYNTFYHGYTPYGGRFRGHTIRSNGWSHTSFYGW